MGDDVAEEIWKERCNNCIRCSVIEDCNNCAACKVGKKCEQRRCFAARKLYNERVARTTEENLRQIMAKTAVREAAAASSSSSSGASTSSAPPPPPQPEPEKKKRGRKKGSGTTAASTKKITERDYVPNRPTRQHSADLRKKRTQLTAEEERQTRQCLQPDCIFQARLESKYCSDACGKILAKMRLTEILPQRCAEWFADRKPYEDELEKKKELLNKEMQDLTTAEKNMLRFVDKLHEYIEKLSKVTPDAADEKDDDNLYEACVVCGQADIPLRRYAKHVDLCWSRSEKAISFNSQDKNNETFYCEKYDARTKSYCKRLKSLCPEHRKPGPEHCLNVCGFPKMWDNGVGSSARTFAEMIEQEDPFGSEGCLVKKETCLKHHKWLPSLRGSVELEQACLFQKMFELCHETHKLKTHIDWTNNALTILMSNKPQIVDHEQYAKFRADLAERGPTVEDRIIVSSGSEDEDEEDEEKSEDNRSSRSSSPSTVPERMEEEREEERETSYDDEENSDEWGDTPDHEKTSEDEEMEAAEGLANLPNRRESVTPSSSPINPSLSPGMVESNVVSSSQPPPPPPPANNFSMARLLE